MHSYKTISGLAFFSLLFNTVAAQDAPSGDPAFIPPGASLEKIVDGEKHDLVFAEGPVVTCDGMVLWSDITFTSGPER